MGHTVAQFPHAEDRRERSEHLRSESLWGMRGQAHRLHPLDELVRPAQLAEPSGAREALLPRRRLGGGMGTRMGQIDNLALMDTKDSMKSLLAQEGQQGKGAEGTIAHEHIPGAQRRMEGRHLRHSVGVPGRGERLQHEARASMKQGEHMSHGEPAPRTLPARLAKLFVEFWGIGPRDTRSVDQEGAMPPPSSLVVRGLLADGGCPPQQLLHHREREAGACLTQCGGGKA